MWQGGTPAPGRGRGTASLRLVWTDSISKTNEQKGGRDHEYHSMKSSTPEAVMQYSCAFSSLEQLKIKQCAFHHITKG